MSEVALDLAGKQRGFRWQRALMPGGICEGTAYQQCGFQTAALCAPPGNYHNCGPRQRMAEEYVSGADLEGLTTLLRATAEQMVNYDGLVGKLPERLKRLRREAEQNLKAP